MRTTVRLNDTLVREAQRVSAIRKKRRLVEAGLQALIRQERLEKLIGMLGRTNLTLTPARLERLRRSRFDARTAA